MCVSYSLRLFAYSASVFHRGCLRTKKRDTFRYSLPEVFGVTRYDRTTQSSRYYTRAFRIILYHILSRQTFGMKE